MAFLKRKLSMNFVWILIALQFFLGISTALYPHVIKFNSSKLLSTQENPQGTTQKQVSTDDSPFYTLAGLVILLAISQLIEKLITTNKNKKNITGENFLREYTTILTQAFSLAPDVSSMTQDEIQTAQNLVLKFISDFVKSYFGNISGLKVSVNLMTRKEVKDYSESDFFQKVSFVDPGRLPSSYECVLLIVQSSSPLTNVPQDFALPVDKDEHRLFFGAPRAFVTGKNSIIDDIINNSINDLLQGQPHVVATKIRDFFTKMEYKSFASIPLRTSKGKIIGVVNIQSNQPYVFGRNGEEADEIKNYINPFFIILTALIK
jgi:hypothetical protein